MGKAKTATKTAKKKATKTAAKGSKKSGAAAKRAPAKTRVPARAASRKKATSAKRPKKAAPARSARKASPARERTLSPEQARRGAEQLVAGLMRELLATRRRNYREVFKVEKKSYAKNLWEESRKTYERYLEAEEKERILKSEAISAAEVLVYTSGEGMGKNRYTCTHAKNEWRIGAIDVLCEDCGGNGSCRWCEGKGCLDCQQSGRCVSCSGGGWTKWAK